MTQPWTPASEQSPLQPRHSGEPAAHLRAVSPGPTLPSNPNPYEAEDPLTLTNHGQPATPPPAAPDPGPPAPAQFAYADPAQTDRPAQRPADWGWRGTLRRMTGGLIKLGAGSAERTYRDAEAMVRATFPAGRTIVVSNPKGGAGKTPTTLILSALLADARREPVVAWDNNELRGTLGYRAEVGDPATTVSDVLGSWHRLIDPQAGPGVLAGMLRRQPQGNLVLASSENAIGMQQIDGARCRGIHQLLLTRYGLLVIDTGNNTAAANYGWAVQHADVLVIPTEPKQEHLHVVAQLLELLASRPDTRHLVPNAIVVSTSGTGEALRDADAEWLAGRVGRVLEVPTDSAIASGGRLRISELSGASRRAWTLVAAAVAEAAVRPSPLDHHTAPPTQPR